MRISAILISIFIPFLDAQSCGNYSVNDVWAKNKIKMQCDVDGTTAIACLPTGDINGPTVPAGQSWSSLTFKFSCTQNNEELTLTVAGCILPNGTDLPIGASAGVPNKGLYSCVLTPGTTTVTRKYQAGCYFNEMIFGIGQSWPWNGAAVACVNNSGLYQVEATACMEPDGNMIGIGGTLQNGSKCYQCRRSKDDLSVATLAEISEQEYAELKRASANGQVDTFVGNTARGRRGRAPTTTLPPPPTTTTTIPSSPLEPVLSPLIPPPTALSAPPTLSVLPALSAPPSLSVPTPSSLSVPTPPPLSMPTTPSLSLPKSPLSVPSTFAPPPPSPLRPPPTSVLTTPSPVSFRPPPPAPRPPPSIIPTTPSPGSLRPPLLPPLPLPLPLSQLNANAVYNNHGPEIETPGAHINTACEDLHPVCETLCTQSCKVTQSHHIGRKKRETRKLFDKANKKQLLAKAKGNKLQKPKPINDFTKCVDLFDAEHELLELFCPKSCNACGQFNGEDFDKMANTWNEVRCGLD